MPSGASVKVQMIDNGARIRLPVAQFMTPPIHGHTHMIVPSFSFLVEQPSTGRKISFDLGVRKSLQSLPPVVQTLVAGPDWDFKVSRDVDEILQNNGVDVKGGAIEAIVWSHWHFDHTGDVGRFPSSTVLVTGPGLKKEFFPPYPQSEESPLLASDFAAREHRELTFNAHDSLHIGGLESIDYFGDGSFYLLNTPGHAIGHICELARVTSTNEGDVEDTFVYMGGDTAHHGGEFRPSDRLPLPEHISPSPYTVRFPLVCPGHVFDAIRRATDDSKPFYELLEAVSHNHVDAVRSNERMQLFDAADNVFVVIAHDPSILEKAAGLNTFPFGTMGNWKAVGSAEKTRWAFLADFIPAVELLDRS